jgi:hypothetical protein
MSRYVWPYVFTLRAVGLVEATRQQKTAAVREKFFAKSNGLLPIALRWSTAPQIGFPREPFEVFRRQRNSGGEKAVTKQVAAAVTVSGAQDIGVFAGDLAFLVLAPVTVAAGNTLTLQALDDFQRPIPGQTITLAGNGVAEFRSPGMAAIHATGVGTAGPFLAIGETDYANLADWQKIQTVGLPLKKDEIGTAYKTNPQGFEPPTLDGVTAAQLRTEITTLLQLDPPNTGIPDLPLPAWPVPNVKPYIDWLRNGKSLVPMIERCLQNTIDTDPAKLQADYTETVNLAGIKQASLPGATADPARPSKATLPIPGVVMMGVSTDSFAAVSLGYGTVDIPPRVDVPVPPPSTNVPPAHVLPAADNFAGWDYMVTAPYTFPMMSVTLAALSSGQPPVEAPVDLAAKGKQVHAPVKRNQPAPAVINVSWQPSSIPQGYGVLASRSPNQSVVLNAARDPSVKGYDPYVGIAPINPDPNIPPDQQIPNFSDTGCVLPLQAPPSNERYLLAALDVFGQWSNWVLANTSLSPSPVTKPGVRNVEFLMDPASAVGHVVPATIRIEFACNWEDRSPGQIRFTGNFVTPGAGLGPAPFLGGFAMQNSGAVGVPVVFTFNYAPASQADTVTPPIGIVPIIDASHATIGPVQILKPAPNANSSQVQYRADIKGVKLDFTSVNEIDFALYATATESIRPGQFSDATDPVMKFVGKVAKAFDPLPPAVHFAPPSISWTALPDATGMARGILEWTADPKATGYYVWEATESALLHLLQPPNTPDPPPATPLVTRGATLKTLINANQDKSLQGFARLNKDPITGSRTEIKVPASASTLYVYRISAITAANVEASRSPQVAVFGVPRRNVPGTPRLVLRSAKSPLPAGIQVTGLPVESGAPPAGFRVFRVRNATLSLDGSTMGPAKLDEGNAGWQDYQGTTLAGKPLPGKFIVDTAAAPSWYPYYYRLKAIGIQDLANGLFAGESDFSGVQNAYALPAGPPLNNAFVIATNVNAALVTLMTDLPAAAKSPVGPALVEVLQLIADLAHPGRMITQVILSKTPEQITVGTLSLPLPPPPPPPHIPPLPHLPPPVPAPALARSAPDSNGHWKLFALIPYKGALKNSFMVRLTDPLSRSSNNSF